MSIVIYWISKPSGEGMFPNLSQPMCQQFDSDKLGPALKKAEELRRGGFRHVTISSEMDDCVTKPGVDSIVDGKCPDGVDYTWKKRRP